jgi:hypothetical protein
MERGIVPNVHILMAMFASWRLTELFTKDRITEGLRRRFPGYLWECWRCMSVWASAVAVIILILAPWVNWVFALSWSYIVFKALRPKKRVGPAPPWLIRGIAVSVNDDGTIDIETRNLSHLQLLDLLSQVTQRTLHG